MKEFLRIALKTVGIVCGILMVGLIIFGIGLNAYLKRNDPYYKQPHVVEITNKRHVDLYYCTSYVHDPVHKCIILLDHKGEKVLHLYKNENTIIEIKTNIDYRPEILLEDIGESEEIKLPKKVV